MARKSEGSEPTPRKPRQPAVPLTPAAAQKVADLVAELDLKRKDVIAVASVIASEAIIEHLAPRVGSAKLQEAEAAVARLREVVGASEAAGVHHDPVED